MKMSAFFQFILGFLLGVAILAAGATGLAFLFFGRMVSSPSKPIFSEEKQEETKVAENKKSPTSEKSALEETAKEESEKIEEEKEPEQKEEEEKLPAGAYKARVTWSNGLSLRAEPDLEAERIGGVEYNSELIILGKSRDRKWDKVRLANGTQEGWVKTGNVEKLEEEEN